MLNRKTFVLVAALVGLGLAGSSQAATITQWNFNGDSSTTVPGGTSAPTPAIGAGTASLVGGTTGAFNSGASNGGSSDPVLTSPPNFGWQTTNYPAASANDKTAGTQFLVSTVGYEDITVRYDLRHSNTSSRYEQLQYTLNGSTWIDLAQFDGNAGDTWFSGRSGDLSAITAADDNASFGIRVVSTFGTGNSAYAASSTTYAGTGTWRFDMVTISGTPLAPVPEPVSLSLLAGAGALVLRRRAK